ncbi:MAG: hypothetical protein ABJF05_17775 [Paracoccaceae bacterium]
MGRHNTRLRNTQGADGSFMMDMAAFFADAWVSLCAAMGALIVLTRLDDLMPVPAIARRFRICLWLIVCLMLARIGHWGGVGYLFTTATYLTSAFIPLCGLLIAEGLMRVHAPLHLKALCAGGGLVFGVSAFFQFEATLFWQLAGLLCFQICALLLIAVYVLRRDTENLSASDNQAIGRIVLSLAVILPFLASDYMRTSMIDIPIRLGGISVLALCWLSINLNRVGLRKRDIASGFVTIAAVAILLTFVIGLLIPFSTRTGVQVGGVILAAIMVLAIRQAAVALLIEDRNGLVLQALATAKGHGAQDALTLIRRATDTSGVVVLDDSSLQDFETSDLQQLFRQNPVRSADAAAHSEQLDWLFTRFDATHAISLTADPLRIAILKLSATSILSDEALRALQKTASAIANATPDGTD